MQKSPKGSPSSSSTALVTGPAPSASGSVSSPGRPRPDPSRSRSSRALRTDTPPVAARRSSRAATYRPPATSKTNRTVPRPTEGASASPTVRLLSHRGTDP
ncbi:hypothetical protein GCM10009610_02890 [Pseudonocardia xinjiangensis]